MMALPSIRQTFVAMNRECCHDQRIQAHMGERNRPGRRGGARKKKAATYEVESDGMVRSSARDAPVWREGAKRDQESITRSCYCT